MIEEKHRPRKRLETVAGLLTVLIAAIWMILFVDRVVMQLFVLAGVEHKMPDLYHLSLAEADSICKSLNLELISSRSRVDNDLPPETVLDQFPVAGIRVKPGRRIDVVLNRSEQVVLCPGVIGRSPREAAIAADSLGLIVNPDHTKLRHSESYPEGVVIVQIPVAGSEMNRGNELKLVVSLGKIPNEIVAPDLVGRQFEDIAMELARFDLRLGDVIKFPDSTIPPGTVLTQDPVPGTQMSSGGSVSVSVAIKPVERTTPDTLSDSMKTEPISSGVDN